MWILPIALALADCSEPVPIEGWLRDVDALWEVGLTGDDIAFRTGTSEHEGERSCIDAHLSSLDAARLHRIRPLLPLHSGAPRGAEQAVASLRRSAAASDDAALADVWLARSDALAAMASDGAPPATAEFGTSLAVQVYVDGIPTTDRPLGQPAVIQVFGSDGGRVDATWLPARDPLPNGVQ